MDITYNFLIDIENEYKSQYMTIKQEINVLDEQIAEINGDIEKLEKNIDKTYEMFSSSQTANLDEKTELDVKREILASYNLESAQKKKSLDNIESRLANVKAAIKSYSASGNITLADKIEFIIKLIPVDSDRAILELKNLQGILRKG